MEFIPLIYFIILLISVLKKDRHFSVGATIIAFYIIVSFFGVLIVDMNIWSGSLPQFSLVGTFLYCALLTLLIMPFVRFRTYEVCDIVLDKEKEHLFIKICWILIALNAITLLLSWEKILLSFTLEFYDIRKEYYEDSTTVGGSQSLISFIGTLTPTFSPLLILFFFFSLLKFPHKRLLNILLLISSATYAIISIITAARTQVIYWFLMFTTMAVFFFHMFPTQIKRKVVTYGIVIFAVGVSYMSAVTISRFDTKTTSEMSSRESIIYYSGQQYLNFINTFNNYSFDKITIDRTFPILSKYLLNHKNFNVANYRDNQTIRLHVPTGVFFTLFGDAMLDFGIFGMCLYGLILHLIISKCLPRSSPHISLSRMIIYLLLVRIPVLGIFAYMYASIGYSFFLIVSLLIAYILRNRLSYEK